MLTDGEEVGRIGAPVQSRRELVERDRDAHGVKRRPAVVVPVSFGRAKDLLSVGAGAAVGIRSGAVIDTSAARP